MARALHMLPIDRKQKSSRWCTLFLRVIVPCPLAGNSISHVRVYTHLNTLVRGLSCNRFFSTPHERQDAPSQHLFTCLRSSHFGHNHTGITRASRGHHAGITRASRGHQGETQLNMRIVYFQRKKENSTLLFPLKTYHFNF